MDIRLLGERIKEARKDRGYTLDDLAIAVGINKSTVSRYERGEIENPKLPVIDSFAAELHVNPGWLSGKSKDKSYTPPNSAVPLYAPNNLFGPIKNLRKARGLSADDAAYGIGISKKDYLAIENGANTDCLTLIRVATFYCCSTDFALSYDGIFCEESQIEFTQNKLLPLHHYFGNISPEEQDEVIKLAKTFFEKQDQLPESLTASELKEVSDALFTFDEQK